MTNHAHDPEFADRVRASFAKQHAMDLIHATLPRAISFSPSAGATRFILYSTVSTEALAATRVIAA